MNLTLGDRNVELAGVELRIELNAVPGLRMRLKERHDVHLLKDVVNSAERAALTWQGESIDVLPYGFREMSAPGPDTEAFLEAVLLHEELEGWLTTKPDAPERLQVGIYQNQDEVGGWTFLNNCLGLHFLVPASQYKERIDRALPISTCLPRPIRQDNQQYLGTVVEYLQHHIPEIAGWVALHGTEEVFRFVFFDEALAFELDDTWEQVRAILPSRFAGEQTSATVRKTGMQVHDDQKMALLVELAKHGIEDPLSGFLVEGDEAQLVYLPGPVTLGNRLLLCEAVSYGFELETHELTITLELGSGYRTPASATSACTLEGEFKAWDQDDAEEIRVFLRPPDDGLWQMMDARDSSLLDSDGDMMAEFVLPTTPNETYSGLYVRRVEGDRVVFELQPFHTPLAYGSQQVLNEQLESATFSINTEILALTTADKGTSIEAATGIVMDRDNMMSRADSDIFVESKLIVLDSNVEITEDSVDVKSRTDIANDVQIDGKLEIGGM